MEPKLNEEYEKIANKISEEKFLERLNAMKKEYADVSFMNDIDIARMIVGTFIDEKNEMKSDKEENSMDKISKLESGAKNVNVIGRVMSISNPKKFTTRKGKEGKLANINLVDDTGELRVVLWTENIKLLKNIKEGDVVEIQDGEVKDGYKSALELHLHPRSSIEVLNSNEYKSFPEYEENITPINDITPDEKVNIIGRIIRITQVRTFDKNNKEGKVRSFELKDETGEVNYTLWNNDVELVDELKLNEGDTIKILSAQARDRNGEISLSHWDGRIVKGDFDAPEFKEIVIKIAEAHEMKNVNLLGIVTKIHDTISFERADGSTGHVKSIEIKDDTGEIRVTLWGDDTKLDLNKGDIVEIKGVNIEFDEYSSSGYKVNTNWNTRIIKDPSGYTSLINLLKEYKNQLGPVKIEQVQDFEDDGEEIDVLGRIINVNDPKEFQREDGSPGIVRSGDIADETGVVRVSFWDNKANSNLLPGTPVLIENAKTRLGLFSVELNVGKTSRIIQCKESDVEDLPSFNELEDKIYTTKKIEDLDEDDRYIRLIARIFDLQESNEFQRQDGNIGLVRSIDLGDETGLIRASFWDNKAEIAYKIGDPIKIENPRVTFRNDQLELSVGSNSKVSKVGEGDLKDLPSYKELEEKIYVSKNIGDLEDDDRNIKVSGKVSEVAGDKLLLPRCPSCNNRLEQIDGEYACDYCGDDFDKPNYLLMLSLRLEDETDDISATFFSHLAENLLEINTDEAIEINKNMDDNALEKKAEDLIGLELTLIADVDFDDYNEENRLKPKRIMSKKL
ncbi:MAG: replication protein A [Methanobrevibacter sp.]|jgi:replication factor A1|nr:replication protein A [Candidatus Methanovirga basalitermitum]